MSILNLLLFSGGNTNTCDRESAVGLMVFCEAQTGGKGALTYLQCWLHHFLPVTLDFASLRFFIFKWDLLQEGCWRIKETEGQKALCMVPGTKFMFR